MSFMKRYAFFAVFKPEGPEGGAGTGGAGDGNGTGTGQKTEAEIAAEKAIADKAKADKEAADKLAAEKKFSQADLDAQIEDRLTRERKKQADEAAKAQGEFQKLYETLKPQHDALETQLTESKKTVDALSAIVKKTVEGTIKDWPTEAKELFDGTASLEAQLAQIEKLRPLVARLSGEKPPKKAPNGEHGNKGSNSAEKVESSYMANRYGNTVPGQKTS